MISEDAFLPLSGLQHLLFCERQCALIHVEGIWAENRLTAEGRVLHEAVDAGGAECRAGVTITRGLALRSERLGLLGRADVVEFERDVAGALHVFPVEYKRGRRSSRTADEVQLCAQAMCLEEMLNVMVPVGAVFHGKSRHRRVVELTPPLRALTEDTAARYHRLVVGGHTPSASPDARCRSCSLRELCLPDRTASPGAASRYLAALTGRDP